MVGNALKQQKLFLKGCTFCSWTKAHATRHSALGLVWVTSCSRYVPTSPPAWMALWFFAQEWEGNSAAYTAHSTDWESTVCKAGLCNCVMSSLQRHQPLINGQKGARVWTLLSAGILDLWIRMRSLGIVWSPLWWKILSYLLWWLVASDLWLLGNLSHRLSAMLSLYILITETFSVQLTVHCLS